MDKTKGRVHGLINYAPYFRKYNHKKKNKTPDEEENGVKVFYEKLYYCNENKITHHSLKSVMSCKDCVSDFDLLEYEIRQRMKWFLDGYFTHNIGGNMSTTSTERICELYNVDMSFFRPFNLKSKYVK